MKWCLAEAVRQRVRDAIMRAESMSIHADCSKGYLVARALMCGKSLEVEDGLLGVVNMLRRPDASALELAGAIATMVSDLATPCKAPPCVAQKQKPVIDEDLLLHMCNIVEVFNADAAADEQLSA